MLMRHLLFVAGAALIFAASTTLSAAADEVSDINALFQQGHQAKALERVEAFLAINPRDTRARFLKGVILTDLGKNTEAIRIFSTLTKDFPDLPEPYNNLAVLYALEGDYERARSTLETAIKKNPNYGIAYENLGDLHAKIASQNYEKARQLDKGNTTAQSKSESIRNLLKGIPGTTRTAEGAKPAAAKPLIADRAITARPEAAPAPDLQAAAKTAEASRPAIAPAPPVPAKAAEPAKPAVVPPVAVAAAPVPAKPAVEPPKPAAVAPVSKVAGGDPSSDIVAALNNWAAAWSSKDATTYLAFYAPDFKVPDNMSRANWETQRRARIAKPSSIAVSIGTPVVGLRPNDRAVVTFRQRYRSDTIEEADAKLMVLSKQGGRWLIQEERVIK